MAEIPLMRVWHKRIINEAPATDSKGGVGFSGCRQWIMLLYSGERTRQDGQVGKLMNRIEGQRRKKKGKGSAMRPKIIHQAPRYRLAFRVKVQATAS